jgi:hypothetical protein
MEGGSEM